MDSGTIPAAEGCEVMADDGRMSGGLVVGQVLGKCRIERELGRGAMGSVFLARHEALHIPVALKIMLPEIAAQNPRLAERFMQEARLASRLRDAHVINVLDVEHDAATGLYYLVMDFVDGGSVRDLMRKGALSVDQALGIAEDVTRALVAAADHQIVHRDIKPDNIMLNRRSEARLADFGIAKALQTDQGSSNLTGGAPVGTAHYMSPEQAADPTHIDARSDIYSLGATLYHMLCGEPPYPGKTPYEIIRRRATEPVPDPRHKRPDLPAPVAQLVVRMMAKNRQERPADAPELLTEIRRLRQQQPLPPPKPPVAHPEAGTLIGIPGLPAPATPSFQTWLPRLLASRPVQTFLASVRSKPKPWGIGAAAVLILFMAGRLVYLDLWPEKPQTLPALPTWEKPPPPGLPGQSGEARIIDPVPAPLEKRRSEVEKEYQTLLRKNPDPGQGFGPLLDALPGALKDVDEHLRRGEYEAVPADLEETSRAIQRLQQLQDRRLRVVSLRQEAAKARAAAEAKGIPKLAPDAWAEVTLQNAKAEQALEAGIPDDFAAAERTFRQLSGFYAKAADKADAAERLALARSAYESGLDASAAKLLAEFGGAEWERVRGQAAEAAKLGAAKPDDAAYLYRQAAMLLPQTLTSATLRRNLALARQAKEAGRWDDCRDAADAALKAAPGDRDAVALQKEAVAELIPRIIVRAEIDGKEASGAKIFLDGKDTGLVAPAVVPVAGRDGVLLEVAPLAGEGLYIGREARRFERINQGAQVWTVQFRAETLRVPAGFLPAAGTPPEPYSGSGYAAVAVHEASGIDFVYIPSGTFEMSENGGGHRVSLTRGFYLSKHEVTQEEWEKVTGANPAVNKAGGRRAPVENIHWSAAQDFAAKLNSLTRNAAGGDKWSFRLPTEAEWEWAARAGGAATLPPGGPGGKRLDDGRRRQDAPRGRRQNPQSLGPLRHGRQCRGMVRGLAGRLCRGAGDGSARPRTGLAPHYPRRQLHSAPGRMPARPARRSRPRHPLPPHRPPHRRRSAVTGGVARQASLNHRLLADIPPG